MAVRAEPSRDPMVPRIGSEQGACARVTQVECMRVAQSWDGTDPEQRSVLLSLRPVSDLEARSDEWR